MSAYPGVLETLNQNDKLSCLLWGTSLQRCPAHLRGVWVWSGGPGKWEPEVELGHTQVGIGISGERPSAALSLCLIPEPSPVFLTIPILLSLRKGFGLCTVATMSD